LIEGLNTSVNSALASTAKLSSSQHTRRLTDSELQTVVRLPIALRTPKSITSAVPPAQLFESMKVPISSATVLKHFVSGMTSHEQSEVLDYSQIYFLGLRANKIQPVTSQKNLGYDDDRGDYKLTLADHIAYRFEILQILGRGSFGQVVRCFDHKKNEFVALKVIRNKKRFHRQAAIEVRILQQLRDRDLEDKANLVHLKEHLVFRKHLVGPT
jgi:dual specificity tyrosine-phosphorylation-regulated kinase 2/3/4